MKRSKIFFILLFFPLVLLTGQGCNEKGNSILNTILEGLTLSREEIVQGLRVALDTASRDASGKAQKVDGFYLNELIKIYLPPETKPVQDLINNGSSNAIVNTALGGLSTATKNLEKSLNRAAEEASKDALPIFRDALTSMTIADGLKILQGGDSAATLYMREKTQAKLYEKFYPVVQNAMIVADVSQYWTQLVEIYNPIAPILGQGKIEADLPKYITDKGLHGLFKLMQLEEQKIRTDPYQYASDILRKVFGSPEAKAGKGSSQN